MFSKKIIPETSIMTKAHLADCTSRTESERFPKLQLKPLPKRLEGSRLGLAERVILPSLKQSLARSMVEQQKRLSVAQRRRMRRPVL
ncbi:hypothetical protein SKAU_G00281060 [Synaphobranchus kaupii]|uniref:Coiled coil protein 74 C-terminal domain-containing protein n=1 Tax=Synaphobranchus kaupii TaxID=118154 RepID=A0A9Q1INZ2_SYNKA|nr:hypothetical protein SKAU_G00281060 [Synaphobranchus kaupii]